MQMKRVGCYGYYDAKQVAISLINKGYTKIEMVFEDNTWYVYRDVPCINSEAERLEMEYKEYIK